MKSPSAALLSEHVQGRMLSLHRCREEEAGWMHEETKTVTQYTKEEGTGLVPTANALSACITSHDICARTGTPSSSSRASEHTRAAKHEKKWPRRRKAPPFLHGQNNVHSGQPTATRHDPNEYAPITPMRQARVRAAHS